MAKLYRNDDGTLPKYAWPGGYPLFYLCRDNSVICADCANKLDQNPPQEPIMAWEVLEACDVHWEGEPMICEECNSEIESAYGNPDNDGDSVE
jgi:hypothetical protein